MKKVITFLAAVCIVIFLTQKVDARQISIRNPGIGSLTVKQVKIPQGQNNLLNKPNASAEYTIGKVDISRPIMLQDVTPNAFTLEFQAADSFLGSKGNSFEVAVPAGTQNKSIVVDTHRLQSMS